MTQPITAMMIEVWLVWGWISSFESLGPRWGGFLHFYISTLRHILDFIFLKI